MMCLFKPNTYDPKDWQCPKPSCRTVNFKKRLTCISCGARKPDGANRPLDDWRDGEKTSTGPWTCDACGTKNEGGAMYCMQCKMPSPDMKRAIEEEKAQRAMDEGRGGGLFDRQDPNDRNDWDSGDEEVDEFGRRKKKSAAAKAKPKASSQLADKHKAALERLKNKHAASKRDESPGPVEKSASLAKPQPKASLTPRTTGKGQEIMVLWRALARRTTCRRSFQPPVGRGGSLSMIRWSSSGMDMELLKTEIVDDVAVVRLLAPEGQFPWGTRIFEHRLNPLLIQQVNAALDVAERNGVNALTVIGDGRFFCNGMDLQYISANVAESTKIQADAEKLMSRILTFGVPTVAAINGHITAGGAMLGLAFDKRLMPADSPGLFFVPGIDIGLVYSAGMTELMKAKLPSTMWNDTLCMGKRYQSAELKANRVLEETPAASEFFDVALQLAKSLKSKGKDPKTRETMHGIKNNLYKDAVALLGQKVQDMGFADGTFDATGRPRKS
ncbi:ECI1 [Symbiodinium necroappetens]|uniref:ECI1 protein n=1 Tax=Symbiodinium necroappetens TaxID=1628268 RepID=A0A812LRA2_9DINO|nr:ECI1 [Symbiodinium necroappetens]